jgi:hypothetical protein
MGKTQIMFFLIFMHGALQWLWRRRQNRPRPDHQIDQRIFRRISPELQQFDQPRVTCGTKT